MIYLDNGATSFRKPVGVADAVRKALFTCANPGRGGYPEAMEGAQTVFRCRQQASRLFDCEPEQVVFTANCTQGLNMAIRTLAQPGDRVVISGFEHNAVVRPLYAMGAQTVVAGRRLFDWEDTLQSFEKALQSRPRAAVFTHVSNVFGYILPVEEMAKLCHLYGVPFVLDAAQSAGTIPVHLKQLGAAFVAMPGHKGLLGPQGTGLLLCGQHPKPLICGGTGSNSLQREMPDYLPDAAEAGTLNVPGIAGLGAGLSCLLREGVEHIGRREQEQALQCIRGLQDMGVQVYAGEYMSGTFSFVPKGDCEETAQAFSDRGIRLRAGLHCAPLAHESAGTLETGTVRVSFGHDANRQHSRKFLETAKSLL